MERQADPARQVTQLLLDEFPVPVTLIHDEVEFGARVLVHRPVAVPHDDTMECPCHPLRFTRAEVAELTCDKLNQMIKSGVH